MNLSKHRNVQYCELDKLSSHVRSHYYMRHEHIFVNVHFLDSVIFINLISQYIVGPSENF